MLRRMLATVATALLVTMATPTAAFAQPDLLGSILGLLHPQPAPAATGAEPQAPPVAEVDPAPAVPAASGSGRRIVYSLHEQRIWLVEADGSVAKSHLVSGRPSYPSPGTYSVYSRSRHSRSGSVTFEHMVRFARASNGLAIGFHSIPVRPSGTPIQTEQQLGQAIGRGCVRQAPSDAAFVWDWAPIGTSVAVVG